jgi:T5orf172 domain
MHYVYVIAEEGNDSLVKVGISKSATKRLTGLQTGNPRKLTILHVVSVASVSAAYALEMAVHDRLGKWRLNGEWFDLPYQSRFPACQRTARRRHGCA